MICAVCSAHPMYECSIQSHTANYSALDPIGQFCGSYRDMYKLGDIDELNFLEIARVYSTDV
jgi:hypothetical protein